MILMAMLAASLLIIALIFSNMVSASILDDQNRELKDANDIIQTEYFMNITSFSIPYYISYSIYDLETETCLLTNNPFLPLLKDTSKNSERYIEKDFFSDGDLDILYFSKKVENEKGKYLFITAQNMDNNPADKILKNIPRAIGITIPAIFIVAFFMTFFVAKQTIKPVIKITNTAKTISSSNLENTLPLGRFNDEIDDLAKTFNRLFRQLKIDFEREKQFSSDVSHELKTPLSVIIGQANLLLRWGKNDPEQLEKSLLAIKDEAKSMEAIINNLLELTRVESKRIKPKVNKIVTKELFERLQNEFNQIAPNAKISFEDEEDLIIYNDNEMLHQVLTVSMSNSIKFAGNNCTIKLKAISDEDKIIITTQDNGPGFGDKNLEHVFDRFFCGDEAHTRGKGGCGLGLSIAKVLINAMEGTIEAKDDNGAMIKITLPAEIRYETIEE